MRDPGWPESPFCAARLGRDRQDASPRAFARRSSQKSAPLPGMPGRTLATLVGKWLGVRSQRGWPLGGHRQKRRSSVCRGWSVAGKRAGRSADDAGPHSKSFLLAPAGPGSTNPISSPVRSLKRKRHTALAAWSVDEAAKPDIHHQANRQENKQRGGTPVTHQRQRDAGYRHSADHHCHVYSTWNQAPLRRP